MELGNIRHWFSGSLRDRELREHREAWQAVERLWQATPESKQYVSDFSARIISGAIDLRTPPPAAPILEALGEATFDLLWAEDFSPITPAWSAIDNDAAIAIEFREMIERRRRWAVGFDRQFDIVKRHLLDAYGELISQLPDASCRYRADDDEGGLEVPLIDLLDDPASLIEAFIGVPFNPEARAAGLFIELRNFLRRNLLVASGYPPDEDRSDRPYKIVYPREQKGRTAATLADQYLDGTPFRPLLDVPVPFNVPMEARFEHCHIVGGTGHGKTQLMQRMIHADLVAAQSTRRSVVVIDSQGDLINKLMRLALFDPDAPDSLADRLVIIDPADVEFPASLNLFDAHLERAEGYRPVERERVLNGVIELYEIFFGALLGAELTQKQGVIFKYLARLMLTIPGATIHTLMRLMEDGKPFRPYMEKLEGSAAYFFATEFFHPSFAATKKQILRRLWGVLSTPAFERMFAQERNKLDLFEAMNDGKIILINTAKDLLKAEGSQLFGRFFIALLSQAALERSTVAEGERTPTFVYVDEAQEYFDERIETILNQARKYAISFHCAHQSLDQPSPGVRSALLSNTSFKCVGGVSAKDARALASELRTTTDFLEGVRRLKDRTEFAVWVKHVTPSAIRVSVPLGFLEKQPILTEEAFGELLRRNRERYCGTLAEVAKLSPQFLKADDRPVEPGREPPAEQTARDAAPKSFGRPGSEGDQPPDADREVSSPPRQPKATTPEPGKGGSQHKYVQHLVKQLATERGFRAAIEETVEGGQVDVALYRGDVSIACEISVTSTPVYEAQNLAKCLRAGFGRVWAIAADPKRRRAIEKATEARLSADEFSKIEFLTTEDVILLLDGLTEPPTEESTVRGYKVKVTRKSVSAAEAQDRRETIARVVSQSLRGLE